MHVNKWYVDTKMHLEEEKKKAAYMNLNQPVH